MNKKLIHYNHSSRNGKKISYIVLHDTGNTAASADALNHYKYFSRGNRKASAHYFVDQDGVVQIIEDARSAWHCGDGRGKYGISNSNSIGIEICINEGNNMTKTLDFTRELIRELMDFYSIPKERVIRHYDASRKICPASMHPNNWGKWWGFWKSL